jgi:hypothetical protein
MAKSLLDELASVLGTADAIAKIKANPELADRIAKQDELYGFYKDETVEAPTVTTTAATEPVKRETPPATSDLGAILRSMEGLTKQIADLPTIVNTRVDEVVKARGDELVNSAVARSIRQADELARAREDWNRNYSDSGKKPFDSEAFEKYVNEKVTAGTRFASVTDAYQSFVAPQREEIAIEGKVRERLKERNSGNVPGVTPTTSKTTLGKLMERGRDKDSNGETAVSRAGERLNALLHSNE